MRSRFPVHNDNTCTRDLFVIVRFQVLNRVWRDNNIRESYEKQNKITLTRTLKSVISTPRECTRQMNIIVFDGRQRTTNVLHLLRPKHWKREDSTILRLHILTCLH